MEKTVEIWPKSSETCLSKGNFTVTVFRKACFSGFGSNFYSLSSINYTY